MAAIVDRKTIKKMGPSQARVSGMIQLGLRLHAGTLLVFTSRKSKSSPCVPQSKEKHANNNQRPHVDSFFD